jgi:hypothetical protein
MCKIQEPLNPSKINKPKYEIQDIFKLYGHDYNASYKLNTI